MLWPTIRCAMQLCVQEQGSHQCAASLSDLFEVSGQVGRLLLLYQELHGRRRVNINDHLSPLTSAMISALVMGAVTRRILRRSTRRSSRGCLTFPAATRRSYRVKDGGTSTAA